MARAADVKRGWARFCSKSCKAMEQEKRTGQHAAHVNGAALERLHRYASEANEEGWDGHKGTA